MNKQQIQEVVDMFELTTEASKSCVNRMDSALTKTGSASSRLSMASASLGALRDKYDSETADHASLNALSAILKFASVLGVDNKKTTEATQKSKRENWHDADSAEAQAIIAKKSPRKPKQSKRDLTEAITPELLEAISKVLAGR